MRFNFLRISAFRGINTPIKLEPDGKSLLLVANNGNGKTSILQAIEWGLFGELPCLEGEEFRREDALVNLFDKEGTAVVEMEIENENGTVMEIVRERKRMTKTSGKSSITVKIDGAVYKGGNAEAKISELLGFSLDEYDTMIHLHQEVVREIIEGNEESRDKAINKILGIDALTNFEEVITKHVHQSSTANKSLRGMQKIVDELGIQRKTTENTKKDEEKAFEKIKAKLIDSGIDLSQTSKESEFLFTATVSEMLKTANDLGLCQLATNISGLEKKREEQIEGRIDEAIEVRRILRSAIQGAADEVKNGLNELDFLEKQRNGDLKQIAELKIDTQKDVGDELKTLEIQVKGITNEISNLQIKESKLTELKNDIAPVIERLSNVSKEIESIINSCGDENIISNKQGLLDKQEEALNSEWANLGTYNNLVSSAVKYISSSKPEICPVCDKSIIPEDVLSSLNNKLSEEIAKRIENVDKLLDEVKRSKEQLNLAKKELEQLKKDLGGYNKSLLQIREKYRQFTGFELTEPFFATIEVYLNDLSTTITDKKKAAESSKMRMTDLNRASLIVQDLAKAELKIISITDFHGDNKGLTQFVENHINSEKRKFEEVNRKKEKVDELNNKLDLLEDIATFTRRSASIATFEKALKEIDEKLLSQQNRIGQINDLIEALSDIRETVNSVKVESLTRILSSIQSDINAFYSKLNVHPMFGEVKLIPEERKGTHIYRIVAEGKAGNYQTFVRTRFSQAQRNLVAISLFLAMTKHSMAKMVLLDDPSQSLDEEHKKKLAETLKLLVNEINVVVATQDETFGQQVLKQFPKEKLEAYRLSQWNQNGPTVEQIQNAS